MLATSKYWCLSEFEFSKKLTRQELEHICENMVITHLRKGEEIELNSGSTRGVHFLKKGAVKISTNNDFGEQDIKYLSKKGDVFGILNAMQGENENDIAVAMEDSLICAVDSGKLKLMMTENAKLNNYFFKLAELRIQKLEKKLETLVYKRAETRVTEFILEYINDFGEESGGAMVARNMLSNKEIGKLTSTSRQTVNRVLNQLKNKDYLHFDNNVFKVSLKKLVYNIGI